MRLAAACCAALFGVPRGARAAEGGVAFGARVLGVDTAGAAGRGAAAERQPLRVIGAAFPRTGTLSTKAALERLGFKVYHMEEWLPNGHGPYAARAYEPGLTDAERLFRLREWLDDIARLGYNATLDAPLCYLADYIHKVYPRASILVTRRDSADVWFRSFDRLNNVFKQAHGWPLKPLTIGDYPDNVFAYAGCPLHVVRARSALPWVDAIESIDTPPEPCKAFYDAMPERVRLAAGDAEVVTLNVKEPGAWAKVCAAARVDPARCPSAEPFPHLNDHASVATVGSVLTVVAYVWPLLPPAAAAAPLLLLWAAARACRRAAPRRKEKRA